MGGGGRSKSGETRVTTPIGDQLLCLDSPGLLKVAIVGGYSHDNRCHVNSKVGQHLFVLSQHVHSCHDFSSCGIAHAALNEASIQVQSALSTTNGVSGACVHMYVHGCLPYSAEITAASARGRLVAIHWSSSGKGAGTLWLGSRAGGGARTRKGVARARFRKAS